MKFLQISILLLSLFFIVGCSSENSDAPNMPPLDGTQPNVTDNDPNRPQLSLPPSPQAPDQISPDSDIVSPSTLSSHNTEDDCWITYQGKVYDITKFLQFHPGTPASILPYCGTGTAFEDAFTKKHGTKNVGVLVKMGVYKGELG